MRKMKASLQRTPQRSTVHKGKQQSSCAGQTPETVCKNEAQHSDHGMDTESGPTKGHDNHDQAHQRKRTSSRNGRRKRMGCNTMADKRTSIRITKRTTQEAQETKAEQWRRKRRNQRKQPNENAERNPKKIAAGRKRRLAQAFIFFRHFETTFVERTWFDVDPLTLVVWWRSRWRSRRCWCLCQSCFRNRFPCNFSNVIDVVVLSLLYHLRHVLVYSIHDHDPGTRFHHQVKIVSWSRFRNVLDDEWRPPPKLDRFSCSHESILSIWIMGRFEEEYTLDMSLPIFPVPHRRGSWNTVTSPRSSWYVHWSIVLVNWRWSERFANFCS